MNASRKAAITAQRGTTSAHADDANASAGYNFAYLDEQTKRMIRRALLKAVAVPGYQVPFGSREMPLPYGWGTGGIQVTAALIGARDVLKVIDQGSDDTTNAVNIRRFFARTTGVATTRRTRAATLIQTRHRIPETPLTDAQILVCQVPQPEPLFRLEPRRAECAQLHARADYSLIRVKLYEDIVRHGSIAATYDYPVIVNGRYLCSPSPIPKFDNPKLHMSRALQLFGAGRERRLYAIPPYTCVKSLDFDDHPFTVQRWERACALCGARDSFLDEMIVDDAGARLFVCSDSDYCQERRARDERDECDECGEARATHHESRRAPRPDDALHAGNEPRTRDAPATPRPMRAFPAPARKIRTTPLLSARRVTKHYAGRIGCRDVSFDLYPGEVLCIVGESGSGKSTLLNALALRHEADGGTLRYTLQSGETLDLRALSEPRRRALMRAEWGFVQQNPRDGLRMGVSAGANIGEPLMAVGARHYGQIRATAAHWMTRVELDATRIDELPSSFSGGMQQRLQIARNLVTGPRLVFMDEPTAGLDVSVQARLLDLLRTLSATLRLSVLLVTHDIGVARLLAHRLLVMHGGTVVEAGLTDQVLDDPQHPYTQTLVASVLPA